MFDCFFAKCLIVALVVCVCVSMLIFLTSHIGAASRLLRICLSFCIFWLFVYRLVFFFPSGSLETWKYALNASDSAAYFNYFGEQHVFAHNHSILYICLSAKTKPDQLVMPQKCNERHLIVQATATRAITKQIGTTKWLELRFGCRS